MGNWIQELRGSRATFETKRFRAQPSANTNWGSSRKVAELPFEEMQHLSCTGDRYRLAAFAVSTKRARRRISGISEGCGLCVRVNMSTYTEETEKRIDTARRSLTATGLRAVPSLTDLLCKRLLVREMAVR